MVRAGAGARGCTCGHTPVCGCMNMSCLKRCLGREKLPMRGVQMGVLLLAACWDIAASMSSSRDPGSTMKRSHSPSYVTTWAQGVQDVSRARSHRCSAVSGCLLLALCWCSLHPPPPPTSGSAPMACLDPATTPRHVAGAGRASPGCRGMSSHTVCPANMSMLRSPSST
jgi:hypothetical protein